LRYKNAPLRAGFEASACPALSFRRGLFSPSALPVLRPVGNAVQRTPLVRFRRLALRPIESLCLASAAPGRECKPGNVYWFARALEVQRKEGLRPCATIGPLSDWRTFFYTFFRAAARRTGGGGRALRLMLRPLQGYRASPTAVPAFPRIWRDANGFQFPSLAGPRAARFRVGRRPGVFVRRMPPETASHRIGRTCRSGASTLPPSRRSRRRPRGSCPFGPRGPERESFFPSFNDDDPRTRIRRPLPCDDRLGIPSAAKRADYGSPHAEGRGRQTV